MKKLSILLFAALMALISACEGPMGPPGLDGESFLGTVFEVTDVDFEAPDYDFFFDFPNNFEVYPTDVVLVYMLWEVDNGMDVWRMLPQTIVLRDDGLIYYNFDYTVSDARVFMEGTPDFWEPIDTDDHIIRFVVLPAEFLAQKSVDISTLESLFEAPNLKLNTIEKLENTK